MKKIILCLITLAISLFIAGQQLLFADQTITVTGTVPPQTKDFTFSLTPATTTSTVAQNTTLAYTLSYGSLASSGQTTTVTLTATYTTQASAGVDLLEYVPGSATTGYNGATPVINLLNHTITWQVSLPAGKTQSVSFSVRTNSNYTGSTAQALTIHATAANQFFTFGDLTDTKSYVYTRQYTLTAARTAPTTTPTPQPQQSQPSVTPSPIPPTGTKATSPTPVISVTPLPIQTSLPLAFTSFDIAGVTSNTITIEAKTNYPTIATLAYGTSSRVLTASVSDSAVSTTHTLTLSGLTAHTPYYFKVQAGGKSSDLLSAMTAETSVPQQVAPLTVTFASENLTLSSVQSTTGQISSSTNPSVPQASPTPPVVVLPVQHPFQVSFEVTQKTPIVSIIGIL